MRDRTASPSLCDLFTRTLARRPDAAALNDPLNKLRVTGQSPMRLTYREADTAITALAAQLMNAGLSPGAVVAVQLANTVEYPLVLLAAWRAGLTVALLPQLWRRVELADALGRINARALISASRIDIVDHAEIAMNAAADVFSVRHVFGIGKHLSDGMTPLDPGAVHEMPRLPMVDAGKAAVISFDVTVDGLIAVPRSHINLIAGGLAISMESGLPSPARILSSVIPSSFAGLVSSTVTWLLGGGTLSLHHPFDAQTLDGQLRQEECDTLIAPAQLALRLGEAGMIDSLPALRHVVGLWRTPERVESSAEWHGGQANFTDVYLFGEAGLVPRRRLNGGSPAPLAEGPYGLSSGNQARAAGEILLTPNGTLALRGASTTPMAYRPARTDNTPAPDSVDTGYGARRDESNGMLHVTAPPASLAAIGFYRFRTQDLERWAERLGPGTTFTTLPDQLNGHRLAGRASEAARVREAMVELGLGPLMTEAFRERGSAH
ncbi:MAG: long-chain fatty acid--CoA ligase [Bradyrhizobiaceae bacterium]|nr:MAG: long-chain fatty acid--CoA ligase [Bradyrhizobiaceae bacterium]